MTEPAETKYSFAQLGELEVLDVDALRSLFTIELSGEAFYGALADRVGNDQAARLLRRNGREEAGHAGRVARALALKLGHEFDPSPDMLEFRDVRLPAAIDDFLPTLVQGELDGDAGYRRWADHEPDPAVARLLRLNGREESIHGHRVEEVIALMAGGSD